MFEILRDRYDHIGIEALKIGRFIQNNRFSDISVGSPRSLGVGKVVDVRCGYDAARWVTAYRNGLLQSVYRFSWTCRKVHVAANVYTTGISIYPVYTRVIVIPDENSLNSFGVEFVNGALCE